MVDLPSDVRPIQVRTHAIKLINETTCFVSLDQKRIAIRHFTGTSKQDTIINQNNQVVLHLRQAHSLLECVVGLFVHQTSKILVAVVLIFFNHSLTSTYSY